MIYASVWFIGGQLFAATSDAIQMRMPNMVILYLLGGYAVTVVVSQPEWSALAASLAVGFAVLACGLILFTRGWMGGGDVKLLAASALWLGPGATPALLLLTALVGGLLTLALVACRAVGVHRVASDRIAALRAPMDRVPYGIAIAAAAIAVALSQPGALVMG